MCLTLSPSGPFHSLWCLRTIVDTVKHVLLWNWNTTSNTKKTFGPILWDLGERTTIYKRLWRENGATSNRWHNYSGNHECKIETCKPLKWASVLFTRLKGWFAMFAGLDRVRGDFSGLTGCQRNCEAIESTVAIDISMIGGYILSHSFNTQDCHPVTPCLTQHFWALT